MSESVLPPGVSRVTGQEWYQQQVIVCWRFLARLVASPLRSCLVFSFLAFIFPSLLPFGNFVIFFARALKPLCLRPFVLSLCCVYPSSDCTNLLIILLLKRHFGARAVICFVGRACDLCPSRSLSVGRLCINWTTPPFVFVQRWSTDLSATHTIQERCDVAFDCTPLPTSTTHSLR